MVHPAAKVLKGTNRNMPARNTMVQLLAPSIDHESHNAQRHRQTDSLTDRVTDRQTDVTLMPIADHTV